MTCCWSATTTPGKHDIAVDGGPAPAISTNGENASGAATKGPAAPTITLPKGGGAIRGIGEKFAANPVTGTASMTVPITTSPGRSGFGPKLSLSYDSGSGNGIFGLGWSLSLPSITRKTDKGLPRYLDETPPTPTDTDWPAPDVFILSGAEDLVPVYLRDPTQDWRDAHPGYTVDDDRWVRDPARRYVIHEDEQDGYRIHRFRPRTEGLFARIERWTRLDDPDDVHWRSISHDNILTIYGLDDNSRIADPTVGATPRPRRCIFSWLISETRDDKGNAVLFRYREEDGQGVRLDWSHERNRGGLDDPRRRVNRHLKHIYYGNTTPVLDADGTRPVFLNYDDINAQIDDHQWMFEVVFDYGDHHDSVPMPRDGETLTPAGIPAHPWSVRPDPFSTYRPGFEVRTLRRCCRVLMFHHFPDTDPDEVGVDCLVRSTDLRYTDDSAESTNPTYSRLAAVTHTGYRRHEDGYRQSSFPPIEFGYTTAEVQNTVEEVEREQIRHLPIGIDGIHYSWTDLHGEGIPGVLAEQGGSWYYQRNHTPLTPTTGATARVKFAALETVPATPNLQVAGGAAMFMDLEGDGQPDIVTLGGSNPGFYEHDDAEGWKPFRPFTTLPIRDTADPNVRLVDLTGDGRSDLLIANDDGLLWYESAGENGFARPRHVPMPGDDETGPRALFGDGTHTWFLADMSGDGQSDLVRITDGEICYWPGLGYGHFGTKITMDHAPRFTETPAGAIEEKHESRALDNPDQFDPKRVRLADIDGSGTTDIIYLHRDGIRLYFNQSGNRWGNPQILDVFPRLDDNVNVSAIDLLGNGTACLVWSSPHLADAASPMRYLNLMGEQKPHLLVRVTNNLGVETCVEYAPSTKFYLQDRQAGTPWITRLPFPVHVVERVETWDYVSRNRFVTRYAYHHGYFDGEEREFRGFGMVEQWDTEHLATPAAGAEPADNIDAASHVPPVHTKTWFHTGVYLGREHISDYFAGLPNATDHGEYFRESGLTDAQARAMLLADSELPEGLTLDEEREACRALKGAMLRQEVYADDADHPGATPKQIDRARRPYTVTEQNFTVRSLQPRGTNRHGVFITHAREALSYHYERNPADPRIQHALTLDVDDYGNVRKQAAIGYGRRASPLSQQWDRERQTTTLITYTENSFTNAVDLADMHRTPLPCEAITFELTGYPATGPAGRYQASDFIEPDPAAPNQLRHKFTTPEVLYEATASGDQRRRPIELLRTLYRRDDLTGLLRLGDLQPLALAGESYRLAFTPGLLTQVFQRPREGQAAESLLPDRAAVLGGQAANRGGYLPSQALKGDGRFPASAADRRFRSCDADDHWWIPSGQTFFTPDPADDAATESEQARQHFYMPRRYRDPFGQNSVVDFDAYDLLMVETRDALNNSVTVDTNDYRVLQPRLVRDPNRNPTEIAFDTLGMVVGTAVMGKPLPAPAEGESEGDSLAGFVADLEQAQLDDFFGSADPHPSAAALLNGATTRIVYDVDRFHRTQQANPDDPRRWQPACAATLARESHLHAPLPPQGLKIQLSFGYSDGFGREVQKKIQAEPGPVPQRDVGGAIIVDADGQPVLTPNDVSPRWVGSGWTVFNNKGKPVRQFEPFFTDTSSFETDVRIGVSPVLFYDPAERVVATLHPNHTYDKAIVDPWQQTTYDVNDTCAPPIQKPGDPPPRETGDPRSDPDIGGYVNEYFKTQPATWQTWHAQRIGNALGTDELHAAERAAAHADTPTTAHFDALGRHFVTVARNRVVCPGHDLDGDEKSYTTRVELDIEGNQRAVRDAIEQAGDPLGRIVMGYGYDLLGNRIHQLSMEAGARWMLNDVAGKLIRAWDSRGHNFTNSYDALRRPHEQTVRGTFSDADPLKPNSDPRTLNQDILIDKIDYGEPTLNATPAQEAEAQRLNLRTRILRHCDSAGIATNARLDADGNPTEAYDFKGNLLGSTRQLVSDYTAIPDWSLNPRLDDETFQGSTRYDALNRPVQSIAPHNSLNRAGHPNKFNVLQPVFNEANLLERVDVWLERAKEPAGLLNPDAVAPSPVGVANIDYDAKGQRTLIDYKTRDATVIRTTYTHDHQTFRLTHLYTRRGVDPDSAQGVAFTADCENPNPPPGNIAAPEKSPAGKGCGLQNLHYTYDPAGNITHIRDDAQQTGYFRNQRIEPSNDYTYDALYRLIQADGREHLGQAADGLRLPPTAWDGFNARQTRLDHPGDGDAMGTYTERYVYDAVGNFLKMQHHGSDPMHPGWTRAYTYAENSLTEPGKQSNRLTSTQVSNGAAEPHLHDTHGNMLRMPHLGTGGAGPNMHWDYKDQLRQVDKGGGGSAYYVYNTSGQRIRKVWEKSAGLIEERIYLGGFEIFRKHDAPVGANTATLERETLHILDDERRIALVETRTLDSTGDDQAPRQLIRYQFANHLGTVSLELDAQARIISYEEYAPYGNSTYQAVRRQTETTKRYRYTGKERDEESGLNYHGARYYAAWLGRWVRSDPLGIVAGINGYAYADSSPVCLGDYDGMQPSHPQDVDIHQTWTEGPPATSEAASGSVPTTAPTTAAAPPPARPLPEPGGPWHVDADRIVRRWFEAGAGPWKSPEDMKKAGRELAKLTGFDPGDRDLGHDTPDWSQRAGETGYVRNERARGPGGNRSKGATVERPAAREAKAQGEYARVNRRDPTAAPGTRSSPRSLGTRTPSTIKPPSSTPPTGAAEAPPPAATPKAAAPGFSLPKGVGTTLNAAGGALIIHDVLMMAREQHIAEQGYVRIGRAVLDDAGGEYVIEITKGLIVNDYIKTYISGPMAGQTKELGFFEMRDEVKKRDAKYGYFNWKGDFVPGKVAPVEVDPYGA